uniref:Uncharacterized protein n=1 Tax=Anguilla anguilla TaxID=7936 RepID=A0A0E9WJK4_ANGAN
MYTYKYIQTKNDFFELEHVNFHRLSTENEPCNERTLLPCKERLLYYGSSEYTI